MLGTIIEYNMEYSALEFYAKSNKPLLKLKIAGGQAPAILFTYALLRNL